ncbi:MAG: hypothetical protein EA424_22445 [Planctomycetaceae bacterium]|nr:MAG: hypothetical protein EA424_22445 [Planctomycetaceae bacterium]
MGKEFRPVGGRPSMLIVKYVPGRSQGSQLIAVAFPLGGIRRPLTDFFDDASQTASCDEDCGGKVEN